jgi:hypothetical protein
VEIRPLLVCTETLALFRRRWGWRRWWGTRRCVAVLCNSRRFRLFGPVLHAIHFLTSLEGLVVLVDYVAEGVDFVVVTEPVRSLFSSFLPAMERWGFLTVLSLC